MTQREIRVAEMEGIYDDAVRLLGVMRRNLANFDRLKAMMTELERYYSTDWRGDYEADERGELPQDMKRGVLSQDALYDLLSEYTDYLEDVLDRINGFRAQLEADDIANE